MLTIFPMQSEPFTSVEHTVTVQAPIAVAFERWNRVEDYPQFMEGVREIAWIDEKRFSLKSEHEGQLYVSLCELILKIPDRRMAWRTLEGPDSSGVVCFQNAGHGRTEVTLKMRYNPATGWTNQEQVSSRLQRNLERFRVLVEEGKSVETR